MVNVAVLGYGTIGSGVVEVLQTNTEVIAQRAGEEIAVKYILDLRDFPGDPNADKIVHDYDIIDKDEDVQVVVECMGGVEPAYLMEEAWQPQIKNLLQSMEQNLLPLPMRKISTFCLKQVSAAVSQLSVR